MNIRKKVLSSVLSAGLLTALFTGAQVATTQDDAQAYTKYNCYNANMYYSGTNKLYIQRCYYDYNWWEELWGYRDGWY